MKSKSIGGMRKQAVKMGIVGKMMSDKEMLDTKKKKKMMMGK